MMREISITHAKMAQVFVHAPLFHSIEKGQQRKQKLDVTYGVGETTFRFCGPELLGATDLRVLQGLVAWATSRLQQRDGVRSVLKDGRLQRGGFRFVGDALGAKTIAVRFVLTSFVRLLGYVDPGQSTLTRIRESIRRMSAVTVHMEEAQSRGSYRLLSGYFEDPETREAVVGLNPIITAAVLGRNRFLRVGMDEVRALKGDPARLLHSRLHWINHGARRRVKLETLCGYLYPTQCESRSALANRRATAKKAVLELTGIRWSVMEMNDGSFLVGRPHLPGKRRSIDETSDGRTVKALRSDDEPVVV